MRLPRMTSRRLMLAVALLALAMGAGATVARWQRTREMALRRAVDCHNLKLAYFSLASNARNAYVRSRAEMARIAANTPSGPDLASFENEWASEARAEVVACQEAARFQELMRQRFLRVATFPWLDLPDYNPRLHIATTPRELRALEFLKSWRTPRGMPP